MRLTNCLTLRSGVATKHGVIWLKNIAEWLLKMALISLGRHNPTPALNFINRITSTTGVVLALYVVEHFFYGKKYFR